MKSNFMMLELRMNCNDHLKLSDMTNSVCNVSLTVFVHFSRFSFGSTN